jgi:hypothetical protein
VVDIQLISRRYTSHLHSILYTNTMNNAIVEFLYLNARISIENARLLKQHRLVLRWSKQRNSSWTIQQKVAMLDTVLREWSCSPIYILKRETDGETTENLFDGAHRLESLHEFMDQKDGYCIKRMSAGWESSPLKPYEGKTFYELPTQIQDKIRHYKFSVNYISEDVANDPEALCILWARLNNAGTPLNGYELKIPVFGNLHAIIEEQKSVDKWLNSQIYTKSESIRGKCEEKLYQLLALSEDENLYTFSSLPGLSDKWMKSHGKNTEEISSCIEENKNEYKSRLTRMRKFLKDLEERGAFKNGDSEIDMSNYHVPLLIFIGRFGFWFKTTSEFTRHINEIIEKLKNDFFTKTSNENMKLMGCTCRNSGFQLALINYIDDYIRKILKQKRRFFTLKERTAKLKEQDGKCSMCNTKVKLTESEADHIIPFSNGGETNLNNCQVVHKHCHRNKGLNL